MSPSPFYDRQREHGTDSCYILGCRRDECRAAHGQAERERRERRREGGTKPCGKPRSRPSLGPCTFELLPGKPCPWHGAR